METPQRKPQLISMFKFRTFLLWGDSANHCTTMLPLHTRFSLQNKAATYRVCLVIPHLCQTLWSYTLWLELVSLPSELSGKTKKQDILRIISGKHVKISASVKFGSDYSNSSSWWSIKVWIMTNLLMQDLLLTSIHFVSGQSTCAQQSTWSQILGSTRTLTHDKIYISQSLQTRAESLDWPLNIVTINRPLVLEGFVVWKPISHLCWCDYSAIVMHWIFSFLFCFFAYFLIFSSS